MTDAIGRISLFGGTGVRHSLPDFPSQTSSLEFAVEHVRRCNETPASVPGEPFWGRTVEQIQKVASNPCDAFGGVMWAGILLGAICDLFCAAKDYEGAKNTALSDPEKVDVKISELKKKILLKTFSLGGCVAGAAEWGHSVQLYTLEPLAAQVLKGVGYGASLFVSTAYLIEAADDVHRCQIQLKNAQNESAMHLAWHKNTAAIIHLITQITAIAWAVLGIVTLFVSTALCPALPAILGVLSGLWFLIGGIGFFYKMHVDNVEKQSLALNPS